MRNGRRKRKTIDMIIGEELVSAKTRYVYAGRRDDIHYIGWVVRLACRNWHTMGRSYPSLGAAKQALVEANQSEHE